MAMLSRAAIAAGLCVAALAAGCASAGPKGIYRTPPTLGGYPYTDADIDFMSGMIPHHAQAVIMAGWCGSHGARREVTVLCERIVVAQRDEIAMMQQWLADRGLPVPDATSTRHRMKMNGIEHDMLMPGMLTDEEMAALDRARGAEFERLFLEGMIKHHAGALTMVQELFATPGAGQDSEIYAFASDVDADQRMEMDRMGAMLAMIKERTK
jgi:uncharacterized protein (DUF305 family)